jgi:hypothetical protein
MERLADGDADCEYRNQGGQQEEGLNGAEAAAARTLSCRPDGGHGR